MRGGFERSLNERAGAGTLLKSGWDGPVGASARDDEGVPRLKDDLGRGLEGCKGAGALLQAGLDGAAGATA